MPETRNILCYICGGILGTAFLVGPFQFLYLDTDTDDQKSKKDAARERVWTIVLSGYSHVTCP